MKVGRELDAAIAKHIFKLPATNIEGECMLQFSSSEFGFISYYSAVLNCAWEVTTKLMNDGWTFDLHHGSCGWHCDFIIGDTNDIGEYDFTTGRGCTWVESFGTSAAHAICLAALKAKGVEI
jgi:hypothetical protein